MMLSILRTLPMVRSAIIAFLLAVTLAVSASGAAAHPARAHRTAVAAKSSHVKSSHARASHARTRHAAAHSTRRATARHANRVTRRAAHSHRATRQQARLSRRRAALRDRMRIVPAERTSPSADAPQSTPQTDQPATAVAEPASLTRIHITPMPPLRGSMESLVRQNQKTDAEGLERIETTADLDDRISRGLLVPVPTSDALTINGNLPQDRRYCRPWTATFLADLSRAHDLRFHRPLEVSSAVRTIDYQKRLMATNGNAAPAEGDVVSPHVTGATIDIAKKGLSTREIYWMRSHLLALQDSGKIDVEEEFQQACFHITVYKDYAPAAASRKSHRTAAHPAAEPPAAAQPAGDPDPDDATEPSAQIATHGR